MATTGTTTTKTCECGCEAPVRRRFLPGHDAKLKGRLINECTAPEWWVREAAVHGLLERNWGHFIPAATVEMALPTRSVFKGRMHETRHINDVHRMWTDESGIGHAFWTCKAVEGETVESDDGWACGTCIHTTDINQRIADAQRVAWVMEAPTAEWDGLVA